MTVAALPTIIDYRENGTTRLFAAPFRFKPLARIIVSRTDPVGVTTRLIEGVDYDVTGGETDAGGTVETVIARPAGWVLRIERATPRDQRNTWTTGDRFPAKLTENTFDGRAMVDQEIGEELDDLATRSAQVPIGETLPRLPALALRRDRLPAFTYAGAIDVLPPVAGETGIVTLAPTGAPRTMRLIDLNIIRDGSFDGGYDGVAGGDTFDGGYDGVF